VVPSRRETFSLVTAEALASGTPVVATRCGGPEEILTEETGQLTDVDDPAALAVAIDAALARSYDPLALRRYAVERFGSAAASNRLGRLYESVTSLGRTAPATDAIELPRANQDPARGPVQSAAAGGTA
jgi:glycosyltransferase involved in cell wall biosynthesis